MMRLTVLGLGLAAGLSAADPKPLPSYPNLEPAVSSFGAAAAGEFAYVFSGHVGKPHHYDTTTSSPGLYRTRLAGGAKQWDKVAGLEGMQGLALVEHKGKLIRVGGMQPRNKPGDEQSLFSLASVAQYDPAKNEWSALPSLPSGRSSHDAVVIGHTLYVFGGWHMEGDKKSTWAETALALDLDHPEKWDELAQPFKRRALTAASFNGKAYVICGLNSKGSTDQSVNVYDPVKKVWSAGPALPGEKMNGFTPASVVANGKLYVTGFDGKIYRLAKAGDAWEEAGSLNRGRFVHRMVAGPDNTVVVLGGSSKDGTIAEVEVFRAE